MDRPLLGKETPAEYFKELVDGALARQHLQAGDLTSYYLVNLLCRFVRLDPRGADDDHDRPLALRLARALDAAGREQRTRLRTLGDYSLFTSGFYSDSLQRRACDVDYYVSMGEYAYGSLSRCDDETFADVFAELSRRFVGYMDVLSDISERTSLSASRPHGDLLRLYEKWLRTGSPRDGRKLLGRGILPNSSIGKSFIQ